MKMGGAKLDLSDSTYQVKRLASEMEKLNQELERVTNTEVKADAAGHVYEARLEAIAKSGRKVTVTLKDMVDHISAATKMSMKEAAPGQGLGATSMAKYKAAVDKIMDPGTGWARVFRERLEYAFGELPPAALRAQQNRVRGALQGLMTGMLTKDWSDNMIQKTIMQMRRDPDRIFTDPRQQSIARHVSTYSKAVEDANARQQQAEERAMRMGRITQQQEMRSTEAQKVRGWLYGPNAFGPDYLKMAARDPRAVVQTQGYMNRLQGMVAGGKVSTTEMQQLYQQWQSGNLPQSLTALQSKAVQAFNQIHLGLTKGTQLAVPFYERMQGIYHLFMAYIGIRWYQYIVSGFEAATKAAAEFQQQIALTQTITQDVGASTQDWSKAYADVSKKGAFSPIEVASAGYDLLSNQVTKGTEDTSLVLDKVNDFARTTGGNLRDAVDTLSSALNAFNMGIDQSDSFLSKFFVTIDRGRIRVDELQKTIGRLNTFSKNVGLNLSESLGGVSLLTRKGIQPETAQTLLLNVYQKLLNPTEKMQKVLDNMGVSTGENLVKTYGWAGALEKLYQAAHGSASEIADMFGEIRGGQGALILMKNLSELQEDISLHEGAGPTYKGAIDIVNQNPGQKLKDQLNQLETYLTTDFKQGFLNAFVNINDAVGGVSKGLITMLDQLKIAVPMLATAYGMIKIGQSGAYFGGLYNQQKTMAGFGAPVGGRILGPNGMPMGGLQPTGMQNAGLWAAAIGSSPAVQIAGFMALEAIVGNIANKAMDFLDSLSNAREEGHKLAMDFQKMEISKLLAETQQENDAFSKLSNTLEKNLRGLATGTMSQLNKQLGELKPKLEDLTKGLRDKFDVVLSEMRRVSEYWRSVSTDAANFMQGQRDYREGLQQKNFESSFRYRLAEVKRARANYQSYVSGTDELRLPEQRGGGGSAYAGREKDIYEDYYNHLDKIASRAVAAMDEAEKKLDWGAFKKAHERYVDTVDKAVSLLDEMGGETLSSTSHFISGYDESGNPQYGSYSSQYPLVKGGEIQSRRWNILEGANRFSMQNEERAKKIKEEADKREVASKEATEKISTLMENYIRGAIIDKTGKVKKEFEPKPGSGEGPEDVARRIAKAEEDLMHNLKSAINDFMRSGNIPTDLQERIKPAVQQAIQEMAKHLREVSETRSQIAHLENLVKVTEGVERKIGELVELQKRLFDALVGKRAEAQGAELKARGLVKEGMNQLAGVTPQGGTGWNDMLRESAGWKTIPPELAKMGQEIVKLSDLGNVDEATKQFSDFRKLISAWGYLVNSGWKSDRIDMKTLQDMVSSGQGPTGPVWHGEREMRPYGPGEAITGREEVGRQIPGFDITEMGSALIRAQQKAREAAEAQTPLNAVNNQLTSANAYAETMARQAGVFKDSGMEGIAGSIDTAAKAWDVMAQKAPGAADGLGTFATKLDEFVSAQQSVGTRAQEAATLMRSTVSTMGATVDELNRIYSKMKIVTPPSADELNKSYEKSSKKERLGTTARYFALGGPVGTDTIPAWLGRDEVVMNSRASKRWYSQLMQMNRGRTPDLAKQTPTSPAIGNLHITVQGGQTTQQTGVEIASALQRAINIGAVRMRGYS